MNKYLLYILVIIIWKISGIRNGAFIGIFTMTKSILEKGIATHSSIIAWRIPWTEEPGGLQSIQSQRVGHVEQLTFFSGYTKNNSLII